MRATRQRIDPWQAASEPGPARIARWWRDIQDERPGTNRSLGHLIHAGCQFCF